MTKRKCWRPLDDTVLTFVSAAVVLSLHSKPTAISGTNNNNQLPSLAFKTIRKGCFITYQLVNESLTTTQGSILATVNWTYVDASDRRTIIHIRQGRSNNYKLCCTHDIDRVSLVCEVGRTWTFLLWFFRQVWRKVCRVAFHHTVACSTERNYKRKKLSIGVNKGNEK